MRSFCLPAALLAALICVSVSTAQDNPSPEDLPIAKATPTGDAAESKTSKNDDAPIAKAIPSSATPTTRPLGATITLTNQSVIKGTLTDTIDMVMKTGLGELTIPLSEVAGVRFASAEDTSTTVVMLNGDSLTGATDIKRLTVETEWGNAAVNGSGISSIMLVPNLQWSSIAGLNGKRWYLTEANSPTSNSPSTASTNSSGNLSAPRTNFVPNNGVRIQPRPFGQ